MTTPQKDFWEHSIVPWERAAFKEPVRSDLADRIAKYFRGTVQHRAFLAMEMLDKIKPAHVLELGCGTGRFVRQVAAQPWARRVTGVDISSEAIGVANSHATAKADFIASSVEDLQIDAIGFDCLVGLGLTPHLMKSELDRVFSSLRGRPFFLDYHPSGFSPINAAHAIYRMIKGNPFYHQFTAAQMLDMAKAAGYAHPILGYSKGVSFICHVQESDRKRVWDALSTVATLRAV